MQVEGHQEGRGALEADQGPSSVKGSDVQDDALKGKQIFEDKLEAVPEAKTVQTVHARSATRCSSARPATEGATDGRRARRRRPGRRWPRTGPSSRSTASASATRPPTQLFGEVYIATSAARRDPLEPGRTHLHGRPAERRLPQPGHRTSRPRARGRDASSAPGALVQPEQRRAAGARWSAPTARALTGAVAVAVKNGDARRAATASTATATSASSAASVDRLSDRG